MFRSSKNPKMFCDSQNRPIKRLAEFRSPCCEFGYSVETWPRGSHSMCNWHTICLQSRYFGKYSSPLTNSSLIFVTANGSEFQSLSCHTRIELGRFTCQLHMEWSQVLPKQFSARSVKFEGVNSCKAFDWVAGQKFVAFRSKGVWRFRRNLIRLDILIIG